MIVLVYGYGGSGEGHWQRLLHEELSAREIPCLFPELPHPLEPDKDRWVAELAECVAHANGQAVTFVGHSLGCWAIDHYLTEKGAGGIHGVLLVAPPSPYLLFEAVQSFMPPPMSKEAWAPVADRSVLMAADDDDYASSDEHAEMARTLGVEHRVVRGGRHLNTDAGYGKWLLPLEWLGSVGAIPRP
ncbi:MAG: alpha/beta fold hydrolase [Candidatus Binatia bacterium]|nr:alpha/beta fold hydrolase [Candidatus Binatia bacterium]